MKNSTPRLHRDAEMVSLQPEPEPMTNFKIKDQPIMNKHNLFHDAVKEESESNNNPSAMRP